MIKKSIRMIVERPWLRIGLAAALLLFGLAPVGAPILSDNNVRQVLGANTSEDAAISYAYRYENQPDGTAVIQRTEAGSQNWVRVGTLPAKVLQLETGRLGQDVMFARTADAIWRSTDAAATWNKAADVPSKPLSMAAARQTGGMVLAGTTERGLFASSDRGETWRAVGGAVSLTGPGAMAVPAVAFNPADETIIYATTQVTITTPEGSHSTEATYVSPDSGTRWFPMEGTAASNSGASSGGATGKSLQLLPAAGRPLSVLETGPAGAHLYQVGNTQALAAQLSSSDASTRAAAARMVALAGDRSAVPALMAHLRDTDLLAGDRIAQALGQLGDASLAPQLLPALEDRDESTRAHAAYVLGAIKYEPAVPQLARMLTGDGPLARQRAAQGLAANGSPAAIAALVAPLRDGEVTASRQAAMEALERLGRPAVPQLVAALQNNDAIERRNAAEVLGYIRSSEAVPSLNQALKDADPEVRAQAAWALGEIGTVPAQQALTQAVTSSRDQATRQVARQALAEAQRTHNDRAALTTSPVGAVLNALTQIPASRWTLLFLVIMLAAILLALKPGQLQRRGRGV